MGELRLPIGASCPSRISSSATLKSLKNRKWRVKINAATPPPRNATLTVPPWHWQLFSRGDAIISRHKEQLREWATVFVLWLVPDLNGSIYLHAPQLCSLCRVYLCWTTVGLFGAGWYSHYCVEGEVYMWCQVGLISALSSTGYVKSGAQGSSCHRDC